MGTFERHQSVTEQAVSTTWKIALALFLNSACVVLLVGWSESFSVSAGAPGEARPVAISTGVLVMIAVFAPGTCFLRVSLFPEAQDGLSIDCASNPVRISRPSKDFHGVFPYIAKSPYVCSSSINSVIVKYGRVQLS